MPDNRNDTPEQDPQIQDLPKDDKTEQQADSVKGGALRRGGDDDLEDLEVERRS